MNSLEVGIGALAACGGPASGPETRSIPAPTELPLFQARCGAVLHQPGAARPAQRPETPRTSYTPRATLPGPPVALQMAHALRGRRLY